MKKRHLVQTGATLVGIAWLSRYLPGRTKVMATSNSEFQLTKTEEEWRKILTPEQFSVLRKHGTERAHTSPLDKQYGKGTYVCAACDLPLFSSETKFNSGTGWPSFFAPIEGGIGTSVDKSFFMTRIEVHCSRCGGHLGHVFEDGPKPTGQRYCMNGAALKFKEG
ncbi:peptide-methionine (R)-S-oxide reductase MsrB [Coleofasciculus sp. LEGE 07081]|uniref:peptide-methionine (R)-S-oxide reductase MsrB n=1 Tax=unclassified Coleofasciculus TaxID=2692782 RepID=UPI001882B1A6|nr:peptide-methionine (R)-S-oxide reductase MsrB [Coleofasciculus sp. LEGE 07081]MBE9151433.1 peptide-methionine (R)-S-oxide reductase MsrB [Coleofasciculus sp. LEGE 07092]